MTGPPTCPPAASWPARDEGGPVGSAGDYREPIQLTPNLATQDVIFSFTNRPPQESPYLL